MTQIGNVPEINLIKDLLEKLKEKGIVEKWEIPYEYLLTRLDAAIFFFNAVDETKLTEIWQQLEVVKPLQYRINEERKISQLKWRVEFKKTN